jgi:hypothetical protein
VKRFTIKRLTAIVIIGLLTSPSYGQQVKLAQTGFNFLNVSSDAVAGGMGDAVNSFSGYSGALTHNPAAMAEMPGLLSVNASVNDWIADIKYLSFSAIVSPLSGEYGVIGLSVQSVNYGDVLGTMVWPNDQGYIDTGVMDPSALAVGIGYAKVVSDRFAVGAQIRFSYQSLGSSVVPEGNAYVTKQNVASAVAFDFGTVFKTGIKSLAFGMSIRNFSQDITYEQESFQLPLLFTFGISANLFDFTKWNGSNQSFILSCDVAHPTSHPEQLKIGAEYQFMKVIFLRGGYITGDSEDGITYGVGISTSGLGISSADVKVDYSYTPFGVFNNVQRFTVSFSM